MVLDAPLRKRKRPFEFRHTDPGGRRAVKDDVFKAAALGEQLVEPHPVMRQIAVIEDRDLIRLRRHRPLLGQVVWGAGAAIAAARRRTRCNRAISQPKHAALPIAMPHIAPLAPSHKMKPPVAAAASAPQTICAFARNLNSRAARSPMLPT